MQSAGGRILGYIDNQSIFMVIYFVRLCTIEGGNYEEKQYLA